MQAYMMFHVEQQKKKPGRPKGADKVRRHIYVSVELDAVLSKMVKDGEISTFAEAALRMACGSRGWKVPPPAGKI